MKTYSLLLLPVLLSTSLTLLANDPMEVRAVVIPSPDSTQTIHVRLSSKEIIAKEKLVYYWEAKGKLQHNQGGFTGNLLHGAYRVTDYNGRLITEGLFSNGLKNNVWKTWDDKGIMRTLEHWEEGVCEQKEVYNSGALVEQISYDKEGFPKKKFVFSDGKKEKFDYKNGQWVRKTWLFEKKKPQENAPVKQN